MAEYLIQEKSIVAIANAIREKTNTTETLTLEEMANKIFSIGGDSYKLPVLDKSYPQDASVTVIKGNTTSATFSVIISEHGEPATYTYQWYVNGTAVDGATSSTYIKNDLSNTATYSVYCEVTNKRGTVTSRVATLNVTQYYTPVLNTSYPKNVTTTVMKGSTTSATFTVNISQAGNPTSYTYQWYKDGTAVSGATSSSYTISNISSTVTNTIYCVVTNKAGSVTSRSATLKVTQIYTPVLSSSYPKDATAEVGASFTSKVSISTAGSPSTYTYQWYKNGTAVSGATSSSYSFTPSGVGAITLYCKVTNSAGTVTSRTATITPRLYLYKAGNQCTSTTGGWISTDLKYANNDGFYQPAATPTKNSTNMVFLARSSEFGEFHGTYTKNKINLTNGTYLKAEINVNSLDWDDRSRWSIRTLTGLNYYNGTASSAGSPNATGSATVKLNVTSLNSSYYIALVVGFTSERNSKAQTTVNNVWLE